MVLQGIFFEDILCTWHRCWGQSNASDRHILVVDMPIELTFL